MVDTITIENGEDANELLRSLIYFEKVGNDDGAMVLYRRFADIVDNDTSPYKFEFESEQEYTLFVRALRRFIEGHPDTTTHLETYLDTLENPK